MRVCKLCKQCKPLDEYYTNKGVPMGKCKECTKEAVRQNSLKVGDKYDRTKKGVFRVIYKTQKRNQKLRGHGELPYTKEQLIAWCEGNNFDDLYKKWKDSGYETNLKPSVDRLDTFKGYSLDNIQLVTWKENMDNQKEDILTGKGTGGKRCKEVEKLDENGNIIETYISFNEAYREEGYSMEYAIKNKIKCKRGFYWRYKE